MRMPVVHARGADRRDPLVGKLSRREAPATLLETAEFLILVRRDRNLRIFRSLSY